MRIVRHKGKDIKIISREVAKRYVRRFGGEIAHLTLLAADGLYDTLRDRNDTQIAVISD